MFIRYLTSAFSEHNFYWLILNRGFSTFHAIFVAFASAYLLLSDLFKEDSRDELIVDRKSTLSDTVLGVSGYRRKYCCVSSI